MIGSAEFYPLADVWLPGQESRPALLTVESRACLEQPDSPEVQRLDTIVVRYSTGGREAKQVVALEPAFSFGCQE